jgi:hypothetical protein
MNVPTAFRTRRVTEALASLALHVTAARNIAASLKPIETPILDLEPEEGSRPIIDTVEPLTDVEAASGRKFKIRGRNLARDSVKSFELFLKKNPAISRRSHALSPIEDSGVITGFEACVDLDGAPSGPYKVRITDENDTPHLPGKTVEIKPKSPDSSSSSSSSSSSPSSSSSSPSSSSSSPSSSSSSPSSSSSSRSSSSSSPSSSSSSPSSSSSSRSSSGRYKT